jgi:hypothetical protein
MERGNTMTIKVEVINTVPEQVCVTYDDNRMEVMYKSEWDKRQVK